MLLLRLTSLLRAHPRPVAHTRTLLTRPPRPHNITSKSPNFAPQTRRILTRLAKRLTESDMKLTDNVPYEFTIIYKNSMSNYTFLGHCVTAVTVGVFALVLVITQTDPSDQRINYDQWSGRTGRVEDEEVMYMATFALMIVTLQVFLSRLPYRIYKVPGRSSYVLISPGQYPFTKRRYNFVRGAIVKEEERGFLPWRDHRYVITNDKGEQKRVILMEHFFRRPADYNIMIGEQKDPDVEDEEDEDPKLGKHMQ